MTGRQAGQANNHTTVTRASQSVSLWPVSLSGSVEIKNPPGPWFNKKRTRGKNKKKGMRMNEEGRKGEEEGEERETI